MKRVRCLYRVSTVKQLDKNDIPMQRIECMNFIKTMPDWELDKEYIEKGVSGYNKRLEDRDVLQEIRKDALNKEFDVLLVFMFDRLGRRDDETPFVVEWFYDHGIEIWSTQEGRQRFDERTDKLTNYMRYWMSAGESEKTSMRVRAKQRQMIEDGINITSVPPYGYKKYLIKLYIIKLCPSKFVVIYVLLICIYFTKEILEAFCLENIKIKFNEKGLSLEAILIQFAKFKLNAVRLDFENNNLIDLLYIDK